MVNRMINALNLIWIVPLSGAVGYMWAAVLTISARADKKHADRRTKS